GGGVGDGPWGEVPAWLPGPADQWAGGSSHAIVLSLGPLRPRTLVLDVRTARTKPFELSPFPAPPVDARGHLRVVVNGQSVATFEIAAPGPPPRGAGPRVSRRLQVTIPASALDGSAPMTVAVINDGNVGVGFEHLRLTEALPSFAVSSLRLNGRFPAMSGTLLAAGLVFFLRGRLEAQRGGAVAHWWRRARGPAFGLLILGFAVA